ncbi:hypothetical protein B0A49_07094 [Cryomyces minteri]|uniref:Serine aminopeptidase S33 domain-containing protein n=1 Tax=Cryomyces minteri TaxID=331657 RepID=A0A4U0WMC3_9PEZI|nr:hypothetical protein B0A49_07094 [Cryomyces minteri]
MERCIRIITSTDLTSESEKVSDESAIPLIVLHGDSDQGMPLEASTDIIKKIMPRTQVKIYKKAGHGLYLTHAGQVLQDLLKFVSEL